MSLASDWLAANHGDIIDLGGAAIPRVTLKPSKRPKGSLPVTIRNGKILRDTKVGSTDTLILKSGLRDLILEDVFFEIDDRSAIKTEDKGARKVSLINCKIIGDGDPRDPLWHADTKWSQHHYMTGGWSEIGTLTQGVFQEHGDYRHQLQGNHAWHNCVTRWCGRTRLQIVNRMAESGTPMPIGYGDVLLQGDHVEDVCLESGGGGSAYTFRGGMPDSAVTLQRCRVRLGCDSRLAAPFNKNITGALVMDSAGESSPGAGDAAWPGGTESLTLTEPDFEVGTVYPGVGSARRSNVKVGAVGVFTINWGARGRIVGGTNGIALEILNSCQQFRFTGDPVAWKGEVKYKGTRFPSWSAFATAHQELRA
jgi:hypothetical protein